MTKFFQFAAATFATLALFSATLMVGHAWLSADAANVDPEFAVHNLKLAGLAGAMLVVSLWGYAVNPTGIRG